MVDIYRGGAVSKLLGLLSVLLLLWSISSALVADWFMVLCTLGGSTLAAYGGYRAAGGRHNPELARTVWKKQGHIDVVSEQVASWPAKVEAMFSMLEQEAGGDYAAALAALKLRNVPAPVESVYTQAVQYASLEAWDRLKRAFIENPPGK